MFEPRLLPSVKTAAAPPAETAADAGTKEAQPARLAAVVALIADEATQAADEYLAETVVPYGGE